MTSPRRPLRQKQLLSLLACLALWVQPLLVPAHLALADHIPWGESHGHDHSHGDCAHGHGPSRGIAVEGAEAGTGGSHPPHPAEDHFEDGDAHDGIRPLLADIDLVPLPAEFPWPDPDYCPGAAPAGDAGGVPRHPPRSSHAPRAPPAAACS